MSQFIIKTPATALSSRILDELTGKVGHMKRSPFREKV
jgi:hypothetical protein